MKEYESTDKFVDSLVSGRYPRVVLEDNLPIRTGNQAEGKADDAREE